MALGGPVEHLFVADQGTVHRETDTSITGFHVAAYAGIVVPDHGFWGGFLRRPPEV